MAEGNSGQSKGLGELFVEFGQKGGSGLMKTLNGISAQFLLTKNSAQQAINMVKDFSKNALNTTVALDKFNAVTGIPVEKLREWDKWAKLNNYSTEEFLGNIKALQENMLKIKMTGEGQEGWTLLGLSPYDFDFREPEKALSAIIKRVKQLDPAVAAFGLREIGLSDSLLYFDNQRNNLYDERWELSKKNNDTLREQQALWNTIDVTWDAAQQKFIANQTWINKLLKEGIKLLNFPIKSREEQYQYIDEKSQFLKNFAKDNWYFWFTPFGALIKAKHIINNDAIEDYITGYLNYKKNPKKTINKTQHNIKPAIDIQNKNTSSQEITNRGSVGNEIPQPYYGPVGNEDAPASIQQSTSVPPSNLTSYNTNNVININQTINSTADATLVANEATSSLIRSLSQTELNNPQVV